MNDIRLKSIAEILQVCHDDGMEYGHATHAVRHVFGYTVAEAFENCLQAAGRLPTNHPFRAEALRIANSAGRILRW